MPWSVRISEELQRKLAEEGQQTAAGVKDYVRPVSVTVDLSHSPPGSFNALEDYLAKALYDSICLSDHVPTGWPKTFPKWDWPLRGVVDLFVQLTGRSLFIHWDEVRTSTCIPAPHVSHGSQVQVLQAAEFSLLTEKKLPAGFRSPSDPLQKGMAQYYAFWSVVAPLLVHPGVYTFATGKQTAFALLGLGVLHDRGLISPTRHKHLVLGALTAKDICETYEKTRLDDGKPLRDYFKTTSVELDEKLGQKIQAATAGHPRMVQLCLNALCQLEPRWHQSRRSTPRWTERTASSLGKAARTSMRSCWAVLMPGPASSAACTACFWSLPCFDKSCRSARTSTWSSITGVRCRCSRR